MNAESRARLFDFREAFAHPFSLWATVAVAAALAAATLGIAFLYPRAPERAKMRKELIARCLTWGAIVPAILGPILLGAAWTMAAAAALALVCYREFARATGFFRHRLLSIVVAAGTLLLFFSALDNWTGFFYALTPIVMILLAAAAILRDEPKGYIQRVALGMLSFLLFGVGFGHLAFIANDPGYRPVILWMILCVELNDVFAFLAGKTFGGRKLCPATSPNKTVSGSAGALVLTTALAAGLGAVALSGRAVDTPFHLVNLGLIIAVGGQFGDLVMSSVKRDLGVKDLGAALPGHGGFLDRFDSLLLVAPAVFHYVKYFSGWTFDPAIRIFSGGF